MNLNNQTQLGVRAIIKTNDGLIMVEHDEKKHGHILIFPGGGIESGENIFQATEREVMEETNVKVKAEKIAYIREILYGNQSGIEFYVLCSVVNGELSLGYEQELGKNEQILKDVRKVGWEEMRGNKWFPEELYDRLESDLKEGFENTIYLGLKKF